jgi:hypothetical protein
MDLYVYYKVSELQAAALAPRVRAMQAALAAGGVAVQLKRRPESKDGMQTWMEVYPGVSAAFEAELAKAAAHAGLADLIVGPRRSEVFVDLTADSSTETSPCA